MHGTTFGGGPLACAVAIAVIDTIRQTGLLAHIRDVGGYFRRRLEDLRQRHDCIVEVRGMGLMLGVELGGPDSAELATQAAAAMLAERILINRTDENVLRFLPPYLLERAHVDLAIAALDGSLTRLTATLAGAAPAGERSHGQ
jgi:acetylornithine aminotransferase/acetylornithine/N-succinyldiaminopimelate aminotransferase